MTFSPNKIDFGNSSISLNVEDGLPQINIRANGITVSIGPHSDLTFDTIKKLGNDLIKFANEGCSASSENIELIYSYINVDGERVFRTKDGGETEIWHNAEPCKLDTSENPKVKILWEKAKAVKNSSDYYINNPSKESLTAHEKAMCSLFEYIFTNFKTPINDDEYEKAQQACWGNSIDFKVLESLSESWLPFGIIRQLIAYDKICMSAEFENKNEHLNKFLRNFYNVILK